MIAADPKPRFVDWLAAPLATLIWACRVVVVAAIAAVSKNLKRRHLDESQRAMVAAKLATMKQHDNQHTRLVPPIGGTSHPISQPSAAKHLNAREHVSAFLRDTIEPSAAGGAVSLRKLHSLYLTWCEHNGIEPIPVNQLGSVLVTIVDALSLSKEVAGGDVLIGGVRFRSLRIETS